jgi:hypothetical protein
MLERLQIKNTISKQLNKKENEANNYLLQISGEKMLELWRSRIGFSNPNHSSRYEIFKKHGFVPPNTSYNQRVKILEGNINPWTFYPSCACSLAWIGRQRNR